MLSCAFRSDSGKMMTMPAKKGDLLTFSNDETDFYTSYSKDIPDTMLFQFKDTLIFLNSKLVGIEINASRNMIPWFRKMQPEDIKGLKSLFIKSFIPDAYLPYLDTISKIKPVIDLFMEDTIETTANELQWLSERFRPEILSTTISFKNVQTLQKFNSVKTLLISIEDSAATYILPNIPEMRELFIFSNDDSISIPTDFLIKNTQLESLSLYGDFDVGKFEWKTMQNLKALRIYESDSTPSSPFSDYLPNLESLQLFGVENITLNDLKGFKHLKELGLPETVNQEIFDQVVKNNKDLELLQIHNTDTLLINDFSVLNSAKHFQYLMITSDGVNANSLYNLTKLKYLSLPKKFFDDSTQVAALKKALPDTVIVPNQGVCMGSGWLLLLIPLVAIGVFAGKKYLSKAA